MFLAAADDIRKVLGFDPMPDIVAAIAQSLDSATVQLESLLHSSFGRASHTDTFYVGSPSDSNAISTQFRLSTGFVVADSLAMSYGETLDSLTEITGYRLDADRGLLVDTGTRFNRHYVRVTYEAGFETLPIVTDPPEDPPPPPVSYDLTQVPKWLQEAATLRAMHLLGSNPSMTEANILLSAKTLTQQFGTLVNAKLRYHPAALLPL